MEKLGKLTIDLHELGRGKYLQNNSVIYSTVHYLPRDLEPD